LAIENEILITLTTDIVGAHVSYNSVAVADVSGLIEQVYGALAKLGAPAKVVEKKSRGVVSIRASIKPEYLISMIDGKHYKMLKRHVKLHGYTPESYRAAFGLPNDYPMIAASHSEKRRAIAKTVGLGRKPKAPPEPIVVGKPPRKPRARKVAAEPANG
jgi:predicted transcriptional regulator